jgi:hypothetical protein
MSKKSKIIAYGGVRYIKSKKPVTGTQFALQPNQEIYIAYCGDCHIEQYNLSDNDLVLNYITVRQK